MDDSQAEAEVVSRWLAEMRRRWLPVVVAGLAAVIAVVAGFAALRSGDRPAAAPDTSETPVTTEQLGLEPVTDDDPTDLVALLTLSDGRLSAYDITECTASGDSTVALTGTSSAGLTIDIDATDMVGEVVVNGVFKGLVDGVIIAPSGQVTVSGIVPIGETSDGAQTFDLTDFACER